MTYLQHRVNPSVRELPLLRKLYHQPKDMEARPLQHRVSIVHAREVVGERVPELRRPAVLPDRLDAFPKRLRMVVT